MSKLNQIENTIKEIDATAFQKLCDCYLVATGYKNIRPIGSVTGMNKPRKGTPDSLCENAEGKPVFVEYTTQQYGTCKKFQGDLEKCFDESKTGVALEQLAEIILFHTERLSTSEENNLKKYGEEHSVPIRLVPLESLAHDLYEYYPHLAKDHLGVEITTGQILKPEDFIQAYGRNQLSTPLDTAFCEREKDVETAIECLQGSDLLLVSGNAGVGKSRLALEAMVRFQKLEPDHQPFCIFNKAQDIYDDVRTYFSRPGKFLILVDDANRASNFDYFIDLLLHQRGDQSIKVIATVRDYALDKIENTSKQVGNFSSLALERFTDEEISKLLEESIGIRNHGYIYRIQELSHGNPRLAIMAGKIAMEQKSLAGISDVTALYDQYFSDILKDLEDLKNQDLIRTAGIISFFRKLDKSNDEQIDLIENVFGIDKDTLWQGITKLHELEIIDLYEDEAAKMSDQVLATYLFYVHFFRQNAGDLEILLSKFMLSHTNLLRDSLCPCINTFSLEETTEKLKPFTQEAWKSTDPDWLYTLADLFSFVHLDKTLLYIKTLIEKLPDTSISSGEILWETIQGLYLEKSILGLLVPFWQCYDDELQTAISLAIQYGEKNPKDIMSVVQLLTDDFGFNTYSINQGYEREKLVIESIIANFQGKRSEHLAIAFTKIAAYYLQTRFEENRSKGRTVTFYRFALANNGNIQQLRKSIFEMLFALYEQDSLKPHVLETLNGYIQPEMEGGVQEILEQDAVLLIPFIRENLNPKDFSDCKFVHDYVHRKGDKDDPQFWVLLEHFTCPEMEIYNLLDFYAYRREADDFNETKRIRSEAIRCHTNEFAADEFVDFFIAYKVISKDKATNRISWEISQGFHSFLEILLEKDVPFIEAVLTRFLEIDAALITDNASLFISKLLQKTDRDTLEALIVKIDMQEQERWKFLFYLFLPKDQVRPEDSDVLLDLYETAHVSAMFYDFNYLSKYQSTDPNILPKVTALLINRHEKEPTYNFGLERVFSDEENWDRTLNEIFKGQEELLKKAYIISYLSRDHFDYRSQFLKNMLDVDPAFFMEMIKIIRDKENYNRSSQNFDILWELDDFPSHLENAITYLLESCENPYEVHKCADTIKRFFSVEYDEPKGSEEIHEKQDAFLDKYIASHAGDQGRMLVAFEPISYFPENRRLRHIKTFLQNNQHFADFKKLNIEPSMQSWSGSRVPIDTRRAEFLEKVKSLCSGPDFLEHRTDIADWIDWIYKDIEKTKKSEFLRDD
ncbi:hypothetical protein [Terasakiella sp.]|uniref:nSTAND3 domain-containing NTPase n=1 Tax=Terasakiella sp. TaxID=2034861 RepID=UPI003AA8982B